MILALSIGIVLGLVIGGVAWWWNKYHHAPNHEALFEQQAHKALAMMMQEIVKTAREELKAEKQDISQTIAKDLRQQSDTFRDLTQSLKQEIDTRQREIRSMEEDRNKKYGEISQALTDYKLLTHELRSSTNELKRILANNQLRGSWGEMQAEKILEAAGMVLGTHYAKQQPIHTNPELRPDFTLYLPNSLELYIDVKFPLQSLQLAMQTEDKSEQQRALQQFGRDLKDRMKETCKYILANGTCVDYVILFVPSESVFEIINRQFVGIIDDAFSQKIILVSPHSFFAVVRTIYESYMNFHYEQNLKEILQYLQNLLAHFERFKGEFAEVGRALALAQSKYKQIEETRYNQIAKATEKITSISTHEKTGKLLPVAAPTVIASDSEPIATVNEE